MEAIDMLAYALDRFTEAYDRRTEVERDRLAFEREKEARVAEHNAAKMRQPSWSASSSMRIGCPARHGSGGGRSGVSAGGGRTPLTTAYLSEGERR